LENFIVLLAILIGFELFESNWQKSDTFYGLLGNNYLIYRKNIFLYIIMHPAFFFMLYFSIAHYIDLWIGSIVVMKFIEISLKLNMMQKIDNNESMENIMPVNVQITPSLRYMNVLLYSSAFVFSILS